MFDPETDAGMRFPMEILSHTFFHDPEVVRGKDGRGPWLGYFCVLNREPASQHL